MVGDSTMAGDLITVGVLILIGAFTVAGEILFGEETGFGIHITITEAGIVVFMILIGIIVDLIEIAELHMAEGLVT